jgi:hypothetical protein
MKVVQTFHNIIAPWSYSVVTFMICCPPSLLDLPTTAEES